MSIDLSIIIPSIRPQVWTSLAEDINKSLESYGNYPPHDYELIFVGPQKSATLPSRSLWIQSYRCPAACLQQGADIARGKYICWLPDDIRMEPEALVRCLNLIRNYDNKDGIIIKYSEGENFSGQQHVWDAYWTAITHDGLRFAQVRSHWKIAPVFMYNTNYFKELGGLDCRFEHVNLNTADLAFRAQLNGSHLMSSPTKVFAADWNPNTHDGDHKSVQAAYEENDLPLFKSIWDASLLDRSIKIDFNNWKNTDEKWVRRFV